MALAKVFCFKGQTSDKFITASANLETEKKMKVLSIFVKFLTAQRLMHTKKTANMFVKSLGKQNFTV